MANTEILIKHRETKIKSIKEVTCPFIYFREKEDPKSKSIEESTIKISPLRHIDHSNFIAATYPTYLQTQY